MQPVAILVATLLVGLAASYDDDDRHGGRMFGGRLAGVMEPRLGINVFRIIQIEKHIERIRERLEEAKEVDPEKFLEDIDARLNELEGTHCEEREFQCGGHSGHEECIDDLFVCDGHEDCHNGIDESDEVCSIEPIRAGHILTGIIDWTSCIADRHDNLIRVTLTSTRRFKFMSSRVLVKAIVESSYDDVKGNTVSKTINFYGGYNFAGRRLLLFPEEGQDLSVELVLNCEFHHGYDERAECVLEHEGSRQECGTVHLVREEHEEEEEEEHHSDAGHHGYYDTTHHEEKKDDDDDDHGKHHGDDDKRHHDDADKHHDDDDRKHN